MVPAWVRFDSRACFLRATPALTGSCASLQCGHLWILAEGTKLLPESIFLREAKDFIEAKKDFTEAMKWYKKVRSERAHEDTVKLCKAPLALCI